LYQTVDPLSIQIDPGFESLLRPLTPEEKEHLELDVAERGVLDPLKMWGQVLVDGHSRRLAAMKCARMVPVMQVDFADRDAATLWIVTNQLGRRNVSSTTLHSLRMRVIASMKEAGATVQTIAEQLDIAPRTVHVVNKQAKIIAQMPDDIQQRIGTGGLVASYDAIERYGSMDADEREIVDDNLRDHPAKSLMQAMPVPKKVAPRLSERQSELLHSSLSGKTRQLIAIGAVPEPTPNEVEMLGCLNEVQRAVVDDLIATRGSASISEAIETINDARKQPALPPDAHRINQKLSDIFEKAISTVDDLANALGARQSPEHTSVVDSLLIAASKWRSWTLFSD